MTEPNAEAPRIRPVLSGELQAPIIYAFLLIAAATHPRSFWGWLWLSLYAAFLAVAAFSTFSPKEYVAEEKRWPGLSRREYLLTMGIPYFALPLAGGLLVMAGMQRASGAAILLGIVVALLPWLLLYSVGFLFARSRGKS